MPIAPDDELVRLAIQAQLKTCRTAGSRFVGAPMESMLGVSRDFSLSSQGPVNGLRHAPTPSSTGWFVWRGDYSDTDDFFEPLHVFHLFEICPSAIKFLGLEPGWRFLYDDHGYVDTWFDNMLLE